MAEHEQRPASIWEMSGNTLIGGGPVSPIPGHWQTVGTGSFNDDGRFRHPFQNTSGGQSLVLEMNGGAAIGGGPVSPNPGPGWKAIGTGSFHSGNGHSDIEPHEHEQQPGHGLGNEWKHLNGGGPV